MMTGRFISRTSWKVFQAAHGSRRSRRQNRAEITMIKWRVYTGQDVRGCDHSRLTMIWRPGSRLAVIWAIGLAPIVPVLDTWPLTSNRCGRIWIMLQVIDGWPTISQTGCTFWSQGDHWWTRSLWSQSTGKPQFDWLLVWGMPFRQTSSVPVWLFPAAARAEPALALADKLTLISGLEFPYDLSQGSFLHTNRHILT